MPLPIPWEQRAPLTAYGYLNITGLEVALLLNFKEAKLNWKRIVGRSLPISTTSDRLRDLKTGNLTTDGTG